MRVRARAIRRCGELIAEVQAARGRRTDLEFLEPALPILTRSQFADDAGLSEHERKTALRIAAVPETNFQAAVESERPPTIKALAGLGTRAVLPRPRWTPPKNETVLVEVKLRYRPGGTIEELAIQREVATLMACWADASAEARKRFLQNINARPTTAVR